MKKFLIFLLFILPWINLNSQVIEIDPLFEYPTAPEELLSLQDKSDYLVTHFWDQLDTKVNQPVNQIALNDAFKVYLTPMRFANQKNGMASIDKLISRINSNPTLLVQFVNAAGENLYGPRAEIWSDDIYLKFLDAAIKNKKISKNRKQRFQERADLLRSTNIGQEAPRFSFVNNEGDAESYFPMSTPTLIIFADPDDIDWRLYRLKMESNTTLNQAIDKGKLNIIFIDTANNEDWVNSVSNYSRKWKIGKSDDISRIYDIRLTPSAYVIDSEGKIALKNRTVEESLNKALELSGW